MDNGEEILREIRGMKTSLFGDDGTGGIVRCLHDLVITVCGNPAIPGDGGMAGDLTGVKKEITVLDTKTAVTKSSLNRSWWWLGGISLAILMIAAFVIRASILSKILS